MISSSIPPDITTLLLYFTVNTHVHADHITGTGVLKKLIPNSKSVISAQSKAVADVAVNNGEVLHFGSHQLEVRETPGHTNGEHSSLNT